ncbi:hypothetical protein GCM10010377_80910 [Streptomyces viridiviolaceus]|nr:hypothetical protein GCM10010377_80910 [Streptomyces viridiviolaceus]
MVQGLLGHASRETTIRHYSRRFAICGPEGRGERALDLLTWQERVALFVEGPEGPEPLWLWLSERGLPFCPHSWNGVFRTANRRCRVTCTRPAGCKALDFIARTGDAPRAVDPRGCRYIPAK